MTEETFDVAIVGARCAGATLAAQLASRGLKVVAVDRARFPSDTPSTHVFQNEGVAVMERLGVLDKLMELAPAVNHARAEINEAVWEGPVPRRPGDRVCNLCIRRPTLDTVLAEHARDRGAELRFGTRVVDLLREGGRVVGLRVVEDGQEHDLRARLVVGADGRGSIVARSVGARRYLTTPTERIFLWSYYEGVDVEADPTFHFYRLGDDALLACPADQGAYLVAVGVSTDRWPEFAGDVSGRFDEIVRQWPRITGMLGNAKRIDRIHVMRKFDGYFRESAGPGWVLVGDAGHFKDPTPGQGISDAFRQTERLADAIVAGFESGDVDARTTAWWRWRDEDAIEKYWFAWDLGRRGPITPVIQELVNKLMPDHRTRSQFFEVFQHRTPPSAVLSPRRFLAAALRLLVRGTVPRRQVLAEVRDTLRTDMARRKAVRNPVYESTEVDDSDREFETSDAA